MQYNSTLYKCLVINLASLSPGTDTAAGQTRGRSRSCAPRARRLARAAWLGCRPSNKERIIIESLLKTCTVQQFTNVIREQNS